MNAHCDTVTGVTPPAAESPSDRRRRLARVRQRRRKERTDIHGRGGYRVVLVTVGEDTLARLAQLHPELFDVAWDDGDALGWGLGEVLEDIAEAGE